MVVLSIVEARRSQEPVPVPAESYRHERHIGPLAEHHDDETVDFGAHTGEHGSFGWYADFPVHTDN